MHATNNNKIIDFKIKEDLTIDELRTYEGLENLTDEEAENITRSLKEFSILLYYYIRKQKQATEASGEDLPRFIKFEHKQAA